MAVSDKRCGALAHSLSFMAAPNRCSSSMMTSPGSASVTSSAPSAWVPTATVISPDASPAFTALASLLSTRRDN